MLLTFKIIFLFMAVFFSLVNIGRAWLKNDVPWQNMFWHAVGVTGFITLQWLV